MPKIRQSCSQPRQRHTHHRVHPRSTVVINRIVLPLPFQPSPFPPFPHRQAATSCHSERRGAAAASASVAVAVAASASADSAARMLYGLLCFAFTFPCAWAGRCAHCARECVCVCLCVRGWLFCLRWQRCHVFVSDAWQWASGLVLSAWLVCACSCSPNSHLRWALASMQRSSRWGLKNVNMPHTYHVPCCQCVCVHVCVVKTKCATACVCVATVCVLACSLAAFDSLLS